jgi:hypothetical protein
MLRTYFASLRMCETIFFHGGKFAEVPVPDLERDRELIDHATAVRESAAGLHPAVQSILD